MRIFYFRSRLTLYESVSLQCFYSVATTDSKLLGYGPLGYVHTIPDSFCARIKTIPDTRASVRT